MTNKYDNVSGVVSKLRVQVNTNVYVNDLSNVVLKDGNFKACYYCYADGTTFSYNQYLLNSPSYTIQNGCTGVTFMCWFSGFNLTDNYSPVVVFLYLNTPAPFAIALSPSSASTLNFSYNNTTVGYAYSNKTMYFVAISITSTKVNMYGGTTTTLSTVVDNQSLATIFPNNCGFSLIGQGNNNGFSANNSAILYDDIFLFSRALSRTEITNYYNVTKTRIVGGSNLATMTTNQANPYP